ncbi:hypothetical protein [Micromonospora sp. WMMA2032]|uniref:hypothetical protein n=1 Tax=Micromonospora sp. WMMA2032 TaxID=2039870 RepID=UPI0012FDEC42|nr:hypothetical protein [Micromonospora sp. WMMA2032]
MTRTRILPAAAVLVALALAGCSNDSPEPAAAPTSSPPATAAAASPAASGPDVYAVKACKRVADALDADGDTLDEMAAAAYEAQQSSEQKLVRAGAAFGERVKLAEAAQGAGDEAVMEANAAAAALTFTGVCAEVGLVN